MEVCRLCLDLATESDVKKLEGTYKDATQIVVPEVNTDISSSPVICQQCTSSLDELYTFKASVVEAENQIKEKVGEDKCQLRLKEVMTGVKIEEKDADLGKSKDRMCRTCLCAIEGKTFTLLKPTQSDAYLNSMLLMCLPEMDLDLTLDPVMCEQCLCNLQKLYHFKSSCLDVEERLNSYCEQHGSSSSSQINLHSVLEEDAAKPKDSTFDAVKSESVDSSVGDYKSEEGDDDVSMSDNSKDLGYTVVNVKKEERDMLKEEDDSEDGDESMGDDAENFTDEEIGELKQEELKIEDDDGDEAKKNGRSDLQEVTPSKIRTSNIRKNQIPCIQEVPLLKCDYCDYTTKYKFQLRIHVECLHYQGPLRQCDLCNYTTRRKINLKYHIKVEHTNQPVLKCDHCDYTTKKKSHLKSHVTRHQITPMKTCDYCSYSSNNPRNLNRHVKYNHGDTVFKCDYCDYTTRTNNNLQTHFRNNHTEMPLLKCGHCDHTCKDKSNLRVHVKRYHSEGLPLLKCGHCDYTSKNKLNLKKHVKGHRSEGLPLLKCEHCGHTTKYKAGLDLHMKRRHSQGLPVLKCEFCDYTSQFKVNLQQHFRRRHKNNYDATCSNVTKL